MGVAGTSPIKPSPTISQKETGAQNWGHVRARHSKVAQEHLIQQASHLPFGPGMQGPPQYSPRLMGSLSSKAWLRSVVLRPHHEHLAMSADIFVITGGSWAALASSGHRQDAAHSHHAQDRPQHRQLSVPKYSSAK